MMGTKATVAKDMMMKLKESFSLKNFSLKRYHSSLICKSKTIRMDVNLIDQKVLTSASAFSGPNFTAGSSRNVSIKNREASSCHEKNLENSEIKNKSAESSSVTEKYPRKKSMAKTLKIGNSLKSTSESGKFKSKNSTSSCHEKNLEKSEVKNKFADSSSVTGKSPKSKNMAYLLKDGSLKSFSESGKFKWKNSVKLSYQANNKIQTKECSEYKTFRCDVCMKYFATKRSVRRHNIIHRLERHPCENCGKVFPTKENLKRHYRAIHEVKVQSLKCSKCFKAFSRKDVLNRHLKKHPDHVQLSPLKNSSSRSDLLLD